jgi:flagellin-like protein
MIGFRKFKKSTKALSPVVASIILIAVTVAVSIATAAWLGSTTNGFMKIEQFKISEVTFTSTSPYATMMIYANNTGTIPVTITQVWVNNIQQTFASNPSPIPASSGVSINVTLSPTWPSGNTYTIKLVSAKGNDFMYTGRAP